MFNLRPVFQSWFWICWIVASLSIVASAVPAWPDSHVITWGENAPEWNRQLGVDGIRLGCSSRPESCLGDVDHAARTQGVKMMFLSILLNPEAIANAAVYSRMSPSHPALQEVGFDDFVGQCEKQKLTPAALSSELDGFARQLKSANSKLNLGITLYMDEVSSSGFDLNGLSADFRKSVNYVHLYPHYRQESQSFASAVKGVQNIFPNAKVIAGVYAYDRIDYLPCSRRGAPCSNEQELALFRDSFQERWSMLMEGKVSAIEFYPGSFGLEQGWSGWNSSRACREGRRQECIANTQQMRQMVKEIIGARSLSSRKADH